MCKSQNVQSFTDVGSRLSTWAWACVLRHVLCAAWVRECCVRPCVRECCMLHACMHGAYSLPLTCSYFKLPLFPPYGDTPSVPKYGVKASLCSQIQSICVSTDFNKWLGTEQNEWSERRGIGILKKGSVHDPLFLISVRENYSTSLRSEVTIHAAADGTRN